jgi:hypothetical protein
MVGIGREGYVFLWYSRSETVCYKRPEQTLSRGNMQIPYVSFVAVSGIGQ